MQTNRIGFYPASGRDYLEPMRMLNGWVDQMVFCDIRTAPHGSALTELRKTVIQDGLPEPSFFLGDARFAIECMQPVDLLLVWRDGDGEGGSALCLLRSENIVKTLSMIKPGGLLVADRRCGGGWFDDFRDGRRSPYRVGGREIFLSDQQPWTEHQLLSFTVK
jgi:hypothetical protein